MVKYKIKTNNENPADVIFEKTGHKEERTLGEIEYNVRYNSKTKREIEAKMGIEKATLVNIERTHPHVVKLMKETSVEDRVAISLYDQSDRFLNGAEEKLKEIDEQIEKDKAEMVEISKQTGKVLMTVEKAINGEK